MDENKNKIKCLFILEILAIPFLLFTLFCVISRARGLCGVLRVEKERKSVQMGFNVYSAAAAEQLD